MTRDTKVEPVDKLAIWLDKKFDLKPGDLFQDWFEVAKFILANYVPKDRERGLVALLNHAVLKNHALNPGGCSACKEIEEALARAGKS